MFEKTTTTEELGVMKGKMPVASLYTVGIAGEKFLLALKNKGQILATPCEACEQVYVPARLFCERCMAELTDYVSLTGKGEVISFTRTHIDLDGNDLKTPQTLAAIQLDGSTTTMIHRLSGKAEIGRRVKAVLEPKGKRKGSILDIKHFA